MKLFSVLSVLVLPAVLVSPVLAAPPLLLEQLLSRAKVVFIGRVTGSEETKITFAVESKERGEPAPIH